jgi:hypothetical protein
MMRRKSLPKKLSDSQAKAKEKHPKVVHEFATGTCILAFLAAEIRIFEVSTLETAAKFDLQHDTEFAHQPLRLGTTSHTCRHTGLATPEKSAELTWHSVREERRSALFCFRRLARARSIAIAISDEPSVNCFVQTAARLDLDIERSIPDGESKVASCTVV